MRDDTRDAAIAHALARDEIREVRRMGVMQHLLGNSHKEPRWAEPAVSAR